MNKIEINHARRNMMRLIGGSACAAVIAPWILASNASAATWEGLQGTASVPPGESYEATMKRLYGSRNIEYTEDKLSLTVPNVAENGAVVPTEVELKTALANGVYVKQTTTNSYI